MSLGFVYFILSLFPLAFIIAFSALELAIAFIQSIVFVILTCSNVKDGLDLHIPQTHRVKVARKVNIFNSSLKVSLKTTVNINGKILQYL
jgi:hypothetical protein